MLSFLMNLNNVGMLCVIDVRKIFLVTSNFLEEVQKQKNDL